MFVYDSTDLKAEYKSDTKEGGFAMGKINHEKFITDMIRYASSAESPEHIINQILKYICENLKSDRAYIFEDNGDGTYDNTYEWCREGVTQEIDNLKNVPYDGALEVWFREYEKSHNIMIQDLEEYRKVSEAMYQILKPQGIKTLVTGPIEINGKYIGFYGVDNPPAAYMNNTSVLINMMEFVISMMIRLRDYAKVVERSATHDQLTNCKNRRAMQWVYDTEFDKEQSMMVMMCDLNGLKKINDTKGHGFGDRYICDAVEILNACFEKENVYRVGGDEFVVILMGAKPEQIEQYTEKLNMYQELKKVSMSFGFAYRHNAKEPFDNLLREADRKMYQEKEKYYREMGKISRK